MDEKESGFNVCVPCVNHFLFILFAHSFSLIKILFLSIPSLSLSFSSSWEDEKTRKGNEREKRNKEKERKKNQKHNPSGLLSVLGIFLLPVHNSWVMTSSFFFSLFVFLFHSLILSLSFFFFPSEGEKNRRKRRERGMSQQIILHLTQEEGERRRRRRRRWPSFLFLTLLPLAFCSLFLPLFLSREMKETGSERERENKEERWKKVIRS